MVDIVEHDATSILMPMGRIPSHIENESDVDVLNGEDTDQVDFSGNFSGNGRACFSLDQEEGSNDFNIRKSFCDQACSFPMLCAGGSEEKCPPGGRRKTSKNMTSLFRHFASQKGQLCLPPHGMSKIAFGPTKRFMRNESTSGSSPSFQETIFPLPMKMVNQNNSFSDLAANGSIPFNTSASNVIEPTVASNDQNRVAFIRKILSKNQEHPVSASKRTSYNLGQSLSHKTAHATASERNNSNTSDLASRPACSDIFRDCQYSGRVIRVEGDGRCLFRSLVTCRCDQLQKSIRDEYGCPIRLDDAVLETQMADDLRQEVVKLMEENAYFYMQLEKDLINADQPANQSVQYQRFGERLQAMAKPSTMPGDLELNATTSVLEARILVLDVGLRYIYLYGKETFPRSSVYAVRYTRLGPDVGHYDAVILEHQFDDIVAQLETQRIEEVELGLSPSLQDLAALNINDDWTDKLKPDLIYTNTDKHNKSCQTQSGIFLASGSGLGHRKVVDKKFPSDASSSFTLEEIHCKEETPDKTKETASFRWRDSVPYLTHRDHRTTLLNLNDENNVFNETVTRTIPMNDTNSVVSKTTEKEAPVRLPSKILKRRHRSKDRSGKNNPTKFDSLYKPLGSANFENPLPSQINGSQYNSKTANQNQGKIIKQPHTRKDLKGNFSSLDRLTNVLLPHGHIESQTNVGNLHRRTIKDRDENRNGLKMRPDSEVKSTSKCKCKRKWHDCNENHKAAKSKRRKPSRNEESSSKATKRKRTPSSKCRSLSKRRTSGKKVTKHTLKKSSDPRGRTPIRVTPPAFPFPSPPGRLLKVSFKSDRKCFVCHGSIPVSSMLGVQCFLCGKVGHRPCVRKHLNWDVDDMTDEYFLCQSCVPL